jgi:hypothetical protein
MNEIIIPELEAAAANYRPRGQWSDDEIAILQRYYGRVPITKLRDHVRHSIDVCHRKAKELGLKKDG